MTQAPQNIVNPGPSLTLIDLYKITLGRLGYAPSNLPQALFFTFAGDILGSSGAHYEKGQPVPFASAIYNASHSFSDDFMESLAMALMSEESFTMDLPGLMQTRDRFYDLLKGHFESASLTYSPWFKPLFEARTAEEFLPVIAGHASCGAAMRAGVLGALGLAPEKAAPLLLCSHAHAEALEGAYLVYGFARAVTEGERDFEQALALGYRQAAYGWDLAENFLRRQGHKAQGRRIRDLYTLVQETSDPYATIADIREEGIETRFVVPAALWLVEQASFLPADEGVAHIVEGALRIGGDPDTICSIAMGLYGLLAGDKAAAALSVIRMPQKI